MTDKFKKEIGFIKNSSSKKDIGKIERTSSEDSFSSFQYDPNKERADQFSPYRHPTFKEDSFRPLSSKKLIQNDNHIIINQNPPKFSNIAIRNNFVRQSHDEKEKVSNIKKSYKQNNFKQYEVTQNAPKIEIHNIDGQLEEQFSLSNVRNFQNNKQEKMVETVKQKDKKLKQIAKYKQYLYESSSQSEQNEDEDEFEEFQQKKTLKTKQRQSRPTIQNQQELITQYDKRQFKDKRLKTAILQHNYQNPSLKKGSYQTKGGICFQLDKKDFKAKPKNFEIPKKRKKKIDADPRVVLLQRRQLSKRYDREARVKVFGY